MTYSNYMKKLFLLLCSLPLFAVAQDKGIQFTHASTWDEVLQKAKAENKLVFVDAYTTWCGPCKYLSKEVFTQDAVGKYFNERFVSVKIQLDTTDKDDEYVKQWYPTASRMMQKLKINVFPTLLFFDANGSPVHRFAGASDGEKLVADAAKALDPDQQFYTLKKRYEAGERDERLLRNFSHAALMAYQPEVAQNAFSDYIQTTGAQVTKENAQLIYYMASKPTDAAFEIIARDPKAFDAVYGRAGAAQERISSVLYDNFLQQMMETGAEGVFQEQVIDLKRKYPAAVANAEAKARTFYYLNKSDWPNFTKAASAFMKQYGSKATPYEKNEIAWAYFEHVDNKAALNEALLWSKASLVANDPNYMDTYANLLHKLGRTAEAIQVETKAMGMATDKESYKKTIEKMKKGERTW
jgi:thioredoxin-related protein